jgi:hypothetical protein
MARVLRGARLFAAAAMRFTLSDGLSWCLCAGRAVFLDLPRDRYFCLPPGDDEAFRSWAANGAKGVPQAALERLAAKAVLSPGKQEHRLPAQIEAATRDLALLAGDRPRLADIGHALVAQLRARRAVRRRPLATSVRHLPHPAADRLAAEQDIAAQAHRIARVFEATALLLRKADQCLPRALAAQALCVRRGIPSALVFGVRLEPFSAHCWVQWEDAVIVGGLEEVRMFTPILVVS